MTSKEYIAMRHKVNIKNMEKEMICDHNWVDIELNMGYVCTKCHYHTYLDPALIAIIRSELESKVR